MKLFTTAIGIIATASVATAGPATAKAQKPDGTGSPTTDTMLSAKAAKDISGTKSSKAFDTDAAAKTTTVDTKAQKADGTGSPTTDTMLSAKAGKDGMHAKATKLFKESPTSTCGAGSFNGIFRYMATSGGDAGKAYSVIINYDPTTENDDGTFTLFADGMSNGFPGTASNFGSDSTLIVNAEDSAIVPFDDTAFLINEDGLCELSVTGEPFAQCPLQGTSKPNCSYVMTAVQLSPKTIRVRFTGEGFDVSRIATRN